MVKYVVGKIPTVAVRLTDICDTEYTHTHIHIQTGSTYMVKYMVGKTPTVSVRLTDIFGVRHEAIPDLTPGQKPQLELRTPAGYTIAYVQNIDKFWDFEYPVRFVCMYV